MRILVQVEGLLTSLIFEHALRVRVKAQDPDASESNTATGSDHDDASSTDGTLNAPDADDSDSGSDTARGAPSTSSKDPKHPGSTSTPAASSSVDVGRISNLVTTDLKNVTNMADFLLLLFYMPVTIVFCVVFLWVILGWRCVRFYSLFFCFFVIVFLLLFKMADVVRLRVLFCAFRVLVFCLVRRSRPSYAYANIPSQLIRRHGHHDHSVPHLGVRGAVAAGYPEGPD
jgi:ABC-type multidrug transport system fused ATPase/permease subunit